MNSSPDFLKLIAHDLRWQLLKALSESDLRVQELVQAVNQPQNLVSYHLHLLAEQGLIGEHRSLADGRAVYYSLNLDRIKDLYASAGLALHPALSCGGGGRAEIALSGVVRILFLCTHNSARSQMAEGILRTRSQGQIQVFSAGTHPNQVHPLTVRISDEMGIDISHQYAKSIDAYLDQDFDYLITVCDRARQACPIFPGEPRLMHWSLKDPAAVPGGESEKYPAFRKTYQQLNTRIGYFLERLKSSQNQQTPITIPGGNHEST